MSTKKRGKKAGSESAIATFLRFKRLQANLTQRQVAQELGYTTPQFISNWERAVSLPPMDVMPKLAKLYAVTGREFVDVIYSYQLQKVEEQKLELLKLFKVREEDRGAQGLAKAKAK